MSFRLVFHFVIAIQLLVMPLAAFANSCVELVAGRTTSPRGKIQQFLSEKRKVTFEDAIEFAKETLPSNLKLKLNEKLEENIYGRNMSISNQTGWRSHLGSNNLRVSQRWKQPLTGYKDRRGKVTWKARIPNSESEFLNLVFDSIRITFKPDLAPITFMSVLHKSRRNKEIANLIETANEVIELEFSITEQVFGYETPNLSGKNTFGLELKRWLQYFTILPWSMTHWKYDRLILDRPLFNALITQHKATAKEILRKRLASGTSLQLIIRYFVKFRITVMLLFTLTSGTDIWSSINYQQTVEKIGLNELSHQELQIARKYAQEIDSSLYQSIKLDLIHLSKDNLSDAEIDFLRTVEHVVDEKISEAK